MRKNEIEDTTRDLTLSFLEGTDIELVDVEYIKEGPNMFLRVYIDKEDGISIEDCQKVSQNLSKTLDELDPIEENYFLEVSSPGIDRPLKTDNDLTKSLGKDVEISLYKSINGKKKLIGNLKDFNSEYLTIVEDLDELDIERKSIAKISLAIKF